MVQVATSEPLSATPPQPVIGLAPSVKATVPARLVPLTVAVKVTDSADRRGAARGVDGGRGGAECGVDRLAHRVAEAARCCWHRCRRWR